MTDIDDTAVISPCQAYRYVLTRNLIRPLPVFPQRFVVCMLNPSVATATADDPTIRRVKSFARREGRHQVVVVNLYALRSTDPKGLWDHHDPVGPDNDNAILAATRMASEIILAWGVNAREDRVGHVLAMLRRAGVSLACLGKTKDGHPRHPLMLPNDAELQSYQP